MFVLDLLNEPDQQNEYSNQLIKTVKNLANNP